MSAALPPSLPQVRQNPITGAVAVKLPDGSPLGEWAVMTVDRGGAFVPAASVDGWVVLINPGAAIDAL